MLNTQVSWLLAAVISWSASCLPAAEPLLIADQGLTSYAVLVGPDALPAERHAAETLADVLAKVTGASFPLITAVPQVRRPVFAVGPWAVREMQPEFPVMDLGAECYRVHTAGGSVLLSGGPGSGRGTVYAVSGFLADQVGCRWWAPRAADIPRRPRLEIPALDERHLPAFEYRDVFIQSAADPDWAARNRCNGVFPELRDIDGGSLAYAMAPGAPATGRRYDRMLMVHTFNRLLPPERHFATHPEWYSEIDGRRQGPPAKSQWCLTNPGLLAACIAEVRAALGNSPPDTIISVSQNDWGFRCQCPSCMAVEQEEGGPSGPILRFANAVADAVAVEFPRAAVDTLAYIYSRHPPRITRPRPNVIVRLCSYETDFSRPFDDARNAAFHADLVQWHAISDRLYIWDYIINFDHYIAPFPNLHVLGPNLRLFARNGVKGLLSQGTFQSPGGEFAELRAWLLARLMWDPEQDDRALIREFVRGFYRQAAPPIQAYIDALHAAAADSPDILTTSGNLAQSYLSDARLFTLAHESFSRAEILCADDEELLRRVRAARLPVDYVIMQNQERLRRDAAARGHPWLLGTYAEAASRVRRGCIAAGVARIREHGGDVSSFLSRIDALSAGRSERPADPQRIDLGPRAFILHGRPQSVSVAADPRASEGVGVRLATTHKDWSVQVAVPRGAEGEGGTWQIYAAVRVERVSGAGDGPAFSTGLYDPVTGGRLAQRSVPVQDTIADGYRWHHVGETALVGQGRYVWIAPAANPDRIAAVWVDRVLFSREPLP